MSKLWYIANIFVLLGYMYFFSLWFSGELSSFFGGLGWLVAFIYFIGHMIREYMEGKRREENDCG
jgi:hypothetical protein